MNYHSSLTKVKVLSMHATELLRLRDDAEGGKEKETFYSKECFSITILSIYWERNSIRVGSTDWWTVVHYFFGQCVN